ncbi:hypothetical protein F4778DRAFT_773057 [Xylariomycetidae sp. FL2044]|nr:hypothetical protein F4778DRAFT_773057 [Xylariomycetidae sp. FL2044]
MEEPRQNVTVYLAERPKYGIVPGKTFESKTEPAPTAEDLKDGEVLVETLYLSLDPSMRGVLNDRKSYIPPVAIGQKMIGGAITRVLASKSAKIGVGTLAHTYSGWTEVAILPEAALDVIELPKGAKITDILMAAFNGPGPTAYIGMKNIAKIQAGETIVISAAAGANGTLVGQIAKMHGARVIGITGSDAKCAWLLGEVGFDVALNYKSPTFAEDLEAATSPDEVDVYWDNVGGRTLELLLSRAAKHSRFVICGGISDYNITPSEERWGVRNVIEVAKKRIRMEGFVILDHVHELPQVRAELFGWIREGKIKTYNTVVKGAITDADGVLQKLFEGQNFGKLSLQIKSL